MRVTNLHPTRGVLIPPGLTGEAAVLAELQSWQSLLPPSSAFTGISAASARGLALPSLPANLPHFAAIGGVRGEVKPDRDGLVVARHRWIPSHEVVPMPAGEPVRVAPVSEALLVAGRVLGRLDLVVLIDSALQSGACTLEDLTATASQRRRGVRALRDALPWVDGKAESAWESMLRLLHTSCGVAVRTQVTLEDADGMFIARVDALVEGTTLVQEYDGADHRTAAQLASDIKRDRRLASISHPRHAYVATDLLHRPGVVMRPVETALGRSIDLGPWWDLLEGSLYGRRGRALLQGQVRPTLVWPYPAVRRSGRRTNWS